MGITIKIIKKNRNLLL